jgi:hypothetical protein
MNNSKLLSAPLAGLGAVIVMGLAALTPSARADNSIYLAVGPQYGGTNPYQYGDGGEFTAVISTAGTKATVLPVPAGYSTKTERTIPAGSSGYSANDNNYLGATGFETFCVEDQVDFYVGYTYNYTQGYAIQQTGGYLTAGTAWLYEKFATGQLNAFNYVNTAARLKDAGELQSAFWFLQGEPSDSSVFPNPTASNNVFLREVEAYFGGGTTPADLAHGLALAEASITGSGSDPYNVEILELYNSSGIAQDQLIYTGPPVKVPDASSTLGLLAASLVVIVMFKRRIALMA